MKCLQQMPVRTSLFSTNFDLLWFIIYFDNPQIGHNITMIFQNKMQTLMRWNCTVRVRYVFCTMPNCRTTRALLACNVQSGICFILLYTVYIFYTYVLQLIINSTIVGLFTVYFIFLQKYLYNKYSLIYISIYVDQY